MTYQETLDWMFSQLPMYQRQGKTAFKKDLTNILAFSKELDFPERKFKTIHVGGTNGKGSTVAALNALADKELIERSKVAEAIARFNIDPEKAYPPTS